MRHAIFNLLIVSLSLAFIVPVLLILFSSPAPTVSPQVEDGFRQLDDLSQQLSNVNDLNKNYKQELLLLKRELEVFVLIQGNSANVHSPAKSAIISFLPHLSDHLDGLVPEVHFTGSNRKESAYFVIGIITRKQDKKSHLLDTLRSLVGGLNERDVTETLIVVLIGERDSKFINAVIADVKQNLETAVNSGLIEIISPKPYFYPDLSSIKPTFDDSVESARSRIKEVLDFSYLMMFCQNRGNFYLQLSDDVRTKEGYLGDMRQFLLDQRSSEWLALDFGLDLVGSLGKLFRASDLNALSEFYLMFHKEKPANWLFEDFLSVKYCNPEKSQEDCDAEKNAARRHRRPSLFTQIGAVVAPGGKKEGKKQLKLFIPHENPPAIATTTLNQYQDFRIDLAYSGENYFWALMPQINDTVTFEFTPPIKLKEFYFRSGNADHLDDRFYDTVVELKMETDGEISQAMFDSREIKVIPGYEYAIAGSFDVNGIAEGTIPTVWPVSILRLRCTKSSEYWVALSEIKLTPAV